MSALLAALKKAAEEKQKKNHQAGLSTSEEKGAVNEVSQAPSHVESEPEAIPFEINFADDIAPNVESEDETATETALPSSESVQLDFVDEQLDTQLAEPAEPALSKREMVDHLAASQENRSVSQSAPVSNAETTYARASEEIAEPPLSMANIEEDTVAQNYESDESGELEEMEPSSSQSDAETNFEGLKLASDATEEVVEKSDRLDLETSLALSSEENKGVRPSESNSTEDQADSEQEAISASEKVAEPAEKNEDWSLDQIPGYQQPKATQTDQAKMHRFVKAIQPEAALKKHFSSKVWIGLIGSLVVLGLGYYGLSVYEKESQLLEQDLKQYQSIAQTPRSKSPLSNSTSSADQQPKVAKPSTEQTEAVVAEGGAESSQQVDNASSINEQSVQKDVPKAKASAVQTATQKRVTTPIKTPVPKTSNKSESKQTQPRFNIEEVAPRKEVFLGYEAYAKGDYAAAERYYQQAYQSSPESLPVLFGLAATAAKKGETQKALAAYRKILKEEPYNQDAKIAVATLEAMSIHGAGVREKLEDLARNSPENAQLQSALGHQYAKKQNWVEAQKYYFRAYELAQQNGSYALNLAVSLDRLGQYRLAKQYYEQALIQSDHAMNPATQKQIKNRLLAIQQYFHQELAR